MTTTNDPRTSDNDDIEARLRSTLGAKAEQAATLSPPPDIGFAERSAESADGDIITLSPRSASQSPGRGGTRWWAGGLVAAAAAVAGLLVIPALTGGDDGESLVPDDSFSVASEGDGVSEPSPGPNDSADSESALGPDPSQVEGRAEITSAEADQAPFLIVHGTGGTAEVRPFTTCWSSPDEPGLCVDGAPTYDTVVASEGALLIDFPIAAVDLTVELREAADCGLTWSPPVTKVAPSLYRVPWVGAPGTVQMQVSAFLTDVETGDAHYDLTWDGSAGPTTETPEVSVEMSALYPSFDGPPVFRNAQIEVRNLPTTEVPADGTVEFVSADGVSEVVDLEAAEPCGNSALLGVAWSGDEAADQALVERIEQMGASGPVRYLVSFSTGGDPLSFEGTWEPGGASALDLTRSVDSE